MRNPYDGGQIGAFKGDAIRNITAGVSSCLVNQGAAAGTDMFFNPTGAFYKDGNGMGLGLPASNTVVSTNTNMFWRILFSTANQGLPTDVDNHPAQMAVAKYIHY